MEGEEYWKTFRLVTNIRPQYINNKPYIVLISFLILVYPQIYSERRELVISVQKVSLWPVILPPPPPLNTTTITHRHTHSTVVLTSMKRDYKDLDIVKFLITVLTSALLACNISEGC